MNNSACGKIKENVRNKTNVRILCNKKYYLKLTSTPSYMSQKIFGNYLVAIRESKVELTLNKPAYLRMCILELSIVLMYKFPYH